MSQQIWQQCAARLADWTFANLVVRTDTYVNYTPDAWRISEALDRHRLQKHYTSHAPRVGIYTSNLNNECRFLVIDIDAHQDKEPANRPYALLLMRRLRDLGFRPFLEHSNGNEGFKLWVVFQSLTPAALLLSFGWWLVRDAGENGVDPAQVEVFPKTADIKGRFGFCVRLPGKHHKRDWWSEFFDGERWHQGGAAAEYLSTAPADNDPDSIPVEARNYKVTRARQPIDPGCQTGCQTGGSGDYSWAKRFRGDLRTLRIIDLCDDAGLDPEEETEKRWRITCPWHLEHTNDDETAFIYINENNFPGFHCFHSHCRDRSICDLCLRYEAKIDLYCTSYYRKTNLPDDYEEQLALIIGSSDNTPSNITLPQQTGMVNLTPKKLVLSGAEFRILAQAEKITWLVQDRIESGGLTIFTGKTYVGKSVVLAHLIGCILEGKLFFGAVVMRSHVLYIDTDRNRLKRIYQRISRVASDESIDQRFHFALVDNLPPKLTAEVIQCVVQQAFPGEPPDNLLVVVDTFRSAFLVGSEKGAESDSALMQTTLAPIKRYVRLTGITVVILHHDTKSGVEAAGSGGIPGVTDGVWGYARAEKKPFGVLTVRTRDDMPVDPLPLVYSPQDGLTIYNPENDLIAKDEERKKKEDENNRIKAICAVFPTTEQAALTLEQVLKLPIFTTDNLSESTVKRRLAECDRPGMHPRLERIGNGKKRSPYRWFRV